MPPDIVTGGSEHKETKEPKIKKEKRVKQMKHTNSEHNHNKENKKHTFEMHNKKHSKKAAQDDIMEDLEFISEESVKDKSRMAEGKPIANEFVSKKKTLRRSVDQMEAKKEKSVAFMRRNLAFVGIACLVIVVAICAIVIGVKSMKAKKAAAEKNQTLSTQEYEKEREDLYEQKEQALIAGDLERVRELLAAEKKLEKKIEKEEELKQEQRQKKDKILPSHIAQVVAKWTHIPVEQMEEAEKERLKKLDAILHERVVGQNDAVKAVARAIRRGRVGLKDPKRPIGSFLFLGPTGVGKTELSKALAEAVFGSEKDMIRVDMSEYMEKQSVSKMIGSPPGYVGYEEGGQLSEKVRRKPYSVLLFDEIEKAHPDVFNMLLQVLEDGHITDAHGKKVDFKNTIIIMTSNAGANRIISPKTLGFGQAKTSEEEYQKMKEGVMEEVKHIFKPEFINRVDEMIVFHALNKENIKDITKIMLKQFAKRVKDQMDMELCIADDVVDFISDKGFDKDYGARPIRRALQTELEDVLAEAVLMGDISIGDTVDISLSCEGTKKKIVVKKKTFADEKK